MSLTSSPVLSAQEFNSKLLRHQERCQQIVENYFAQKQAGVKNPSIDFLFSYFSFSFSKLCKWSPGPKVLVDKIPDYLNEQHFSEQNGYYFLDPSTLPQKRHAGLRWTLRLLQNSQSKTPTFNCYGLHEWAMVYKSQQTRHHEKLPLRLPMSEIIEFVDSQNLVCTHYDALRFYTSEAKPLNKFQITRDEQADFDQAGCLHVNMDLYKWAYKLYPFISSDLIADCFELAKECRIIDMQASPYDVSSLGVDKIAIETRDGRNDYIAKQNFLYQKSLPLRSKLIESYQSILNFS